MSLDTLLREITTKEQFEERYSAISYEIRNNGFGSFEVVKSLEVCQCVIDLSLKNQFYHLIVGGFCYYIKQGLIDYIKLFLPHIDFRETFKLRTDTRLLVTTLYNLVIEGWMDTFTLLLDHGLDPNILMATGETMLFGACRYKHIQLIELLIERGVNVNFESPTNNTAVIAAIESEEVQILDRLICAGADLNKGRHPPIIVAIWYGDLTMIRRLLDMRVTLSGAVILEAVGSRGSVETRKEIIKLLRANGCEEAATEEVTHRNFLSFIDPQVTKYLLE